MKTSLSILLVSLILAPLATFAGADPVSAIMPAYEKTQQALTQDDLEATKTAAKEMADTAKATPEIAEKSQLSGLSLKLSEAPDITMARIQFKKVSEEMTKLLEENGTGNHETIYVMYCPMANGGEGATWLQTHDKVTNPYEGKKMLGCGGVKKKFESAPPSQANK